VRYLAAREEALMDSLRLRCDGLANVIRDKTAVDRGVSQSLKSSELPVEWNLTQFDGQ
jgi:hypothetical protein